MMIDSVYCYPGFRPLMGIILFNFLTVIKLKKLHLKTRFRPLMGIILFNPVFETTDIYWF